MIWRNISLAPALSLTDTVGQAKQRPPKILGVFLEVATDNTNAEVWKYVPQTAADNLS